METLIGAEGKAPRIILDLKDMTLTGQDGVNFLAQCEAAGIALVNCDHTSASGSRDKTLDTSVKAIGAYVCRLDQRKTRNDPHSRKE